MNLYLVEAPAEYDCFRSAVVWAESAAVAKKMVLDEASKDSDGDFDLEDSQRDKLTARKINLPGTRRIVHTHIIFG